MNARLARQRLIAYRPSGEDDHDRDVRAALRFAKKTPDLAATFANQLAFDHALADRLEAVAVPAEVAAPLAEAAKRFEGRRSRRFSFRDPAVLAAGLAFLFLVGLGAWLLMGQLGSFAGMQEVAEMVADGNRAGPEKFEEIDTTAGSLADWFVMQDFDGYALPPEMAGVPVVGVRIMRFDELSVAVAAIARPRAFLYVFEAHPLGLALPEGRWKIGAFGPGLKRAFAVQQIGAMAVAIAPLEGGKAELEAALESLKTAP